MSQVFQQFGDVKSFLQDNEDVGPSIRGKLLEILCNCQELITLKMKLFSVIDVGVRFVTATLVGEGWSTRVNCYEKILKLF